MNSAKFGIDLGTWQTINTKTITIEIRVNLISLLLSASPITVCPLKQLHFTRLNYSMRAIISRGLFIFYPGLYCRAVYNADRLIFHHSFFSSNLYKNAIQLASKNRLLTTFLLYILTLVFFRIRCSLYCRRVCLTRNFSEPQNPRLLIKSGF